MFQRIHLKSQHEIEVMREANLVVADVLDAFEEAIQPGVSTLDLDVIARRILDERGAKSAFLDYHGYPATVCTSINDEVVHGIPSADRILVDGDIVGTDFGAIVDGYVGDAARTFAVGSISAEARRLLDVTRECLARAIEQCVPGNRVADVAQAVQAHGEACGYGIVRDFVGHGIGRRMHENPQVPNFVEERGQFGKSLRVRLQPGMVIAIEPMLNAGGWEVVVLEDNWTAVTSDGSLSAHFEHSVAITDDEPLVLSSRGPWRAHAAGAGGLPRAQGGAE